MLVFMYLFLSSLDTDDDFLLTSTSTTTGQRRQTLPDVINAMDADSSSGSSLGMISSEAVIKKSTAASTAASLASRKMSVPDASQSVSISCTLQSFHCVFR